MLVPLIVIAALGGGAYWLYRRSQGEESAGTGAPTPATTPPTARPPAPPIPPPPADAITSAPSSGSTLPVYAVSIVIKQGWDDVLNDTYVFYNEASAETYYWILKTFFDDPYVYKAYTYPSGTIMVHKAGTPPSASRTAMYNQNGPMAA
jgi:hypothetical protein